MAEDLRVIELLGPALVTFVLAAWLALAVAAAAAAVVAAVAVVVGLAVEGLFVPCNAEPTPNLRLPNFLLRYQRKPSAPCMEGHRPVAIPEASSARSSAALASSFPGVSSLLPAFADPLPTLPAASSASTRLRPAIVKERQGVAPAVG